LLSRQLSEINVKAYGISRSGLHGPDGKLCGKVSIGNATAVKETILTIRPEKIFYLAAYHHSSQEAAASDPMIMRRSFSVHVFGLLNILQAMLVHAPSARLFYAASSHIFGIPRETPQDETTPMEPISPYGISKAAGVNICRMYRQHNNLYCSVGILYNHESPHRSARFVTVKIVRSAVAIERGARDRLVLGNLDSKVNWGYAPEYTDAMMRILELDHADDFIISSGRVNTIRDFVEAVFDYIGLNWRDHVIQDSSLLEKAEMESFFVGDSARLREATAWRPHAGIGQIAKIMVDAERQRV